TICFSRPRPVQVYVQVINLVTGSNFPHDGNDRLVAAIVNYIGSQEAGGVGVGETLYHQRIRAVLCTFPVDLDFYILLGTSPDDLQEQNIEVDSRSKVVTEEGMVSIARRTGTLKRCSTCSPMPTTGATWSMCRRAAPLKPTSANCSLCLHI